MIRALLVDDEEPARARLRELLAACTGVIVVGEADDGVDAMARIIDLAPDVVFLDIQMPGLSGLDLARRLPPPRPRIVFCTAYDAFAVEAFEQHAVDYLLKPVGRERLAATVTRIGREIADRRARDEAARTQARLMPRAGLTLGALECFGSCRPAQGISGDYFDLLPTPDGRAVITVGDVSGKGDYAGLLAAALQARLQTLVAGGLSGPARLLGAVNELTISTIEHHRFATLFAGVLDPRTQTLTYASAGHPPALIVSEDGSCRELPSSGPAIGWMGDAVFGEATVSLRPGDALLVYTDGITEAASQAGADLGAEGLGRLAAPLLREPAASLVSRLLEAVDSFASGVPPHDDRTLVVAKVRDR